MVRRQAAKDVVRWHAQMARPMWEIRGAEGGHWIMWRLVGAYDDQKQALDACMTSGRSICAGMNLPEAPADL